jgi:hypothetical protein
MLLKGTVLEGVDWINVVQVRNITGVLWICKYTQKQDELKPSTSTWLRPFTSSFSRLSWTLSLSCSRTKLISSVWVYLHSINPKQVSAFGYRTSQRVTYISFLVQIILA